jgi:hypothetical protein
VRIGRVATYIAIVCRQTVMYRSIANHGTLLCAMIGQRVYPPRLSSNLNSRETLSRVFFRRLTPTDSRSYISWATFACATAQALSALPVI